MSYTDLNKLTQGLTVRGEETLIKAFSSKMTDAQGELLRYFGGLKKSSGLPLDNDWRGEGRELL